jgi:hypothetical protein
MIRAVTHVAPVAERAALGITRVEDLAPEAIARPLGEIRAACRIGRLSHRLEGQSESDDACGLREPSSDAHAQPPGTLPNPALTPGAVRTTSRASPGAVPVMLSPGLSLGRVMSSACRPAPSSSLGRGDARRKCIIRMLPPLLTRGVGGKQKAPSFDNHRIHCNGEAMTPPEQCDRPRQRGHGGAKA